MMSRPARMLWLLFGALVAVAWLLPPIPQPPAYHRFADRSHCLGVMHCLDVASNLPIILAGLAGLGFLGSAAARRVFRERRDMLPYALFFGAAVLVGFASAHYHLAPDNGRLVWDRAAIALALMSWFSAIIGERVGRDWGRRLLPVLLVAGLGSAGYWGWSESVGRGDLRAYGLMQFVPLLFVPLLLHLYPSRHGGDRDILAVLGLYVAALACDFLDRPIADLAGFVSGHTLKHLLAAGAIWQVMAGLNTRQPPP